MNENSVSNNDRQSREDPERPEKAKRLKMESTVPLEETSDEPAGTSKPESAYCNISAGLDENPTVFRSDEPNDTSEPSSVVEPEMSISQTTEAVESATAVADKTEDSNSQKPKDSQESEKPLALEKSDESSCNNTESTSSDSGFPRSRNSRNRSYRRSNEERTEEDTENRRGSNDNDGSEEASDYRSSGDEEEEDSSAIDEHSEDMFNSSSSDSTIIHDTDTESDNGEVHPVLKKPKPKPNWYILPELINRQIGYQVKYSHPSLFMRRCYGSLHCVTRLELMYKLDEHDGCVNCLNFHPNGTLLASGSDDRMVCLWDWKRDNCILKYDTRHSSNVFQSKFLHLSGDLHIATCARDGQVRIAQINSEGVKDNRKLGAHKGACHKLSVMVDQPHVILSAGEDGVVLRHDVRRNQPERIVNVTSGAKDCSYRALYSIHSNPLQTNEFCVCGREEIIRVYDQRKSDKPTATYQPYEWYKKATKGVHVTCAVYNWNGSEILGSYTDDSIYLFDTKAPAGRNTIHKYMGHKNVATIKGVNFFGPKSEFIVSGSDCGNLYFWERNTEAIVQWLLADDKRVVNCVEPHPQLPFIATSGLDWDIKLWVPSHEHPPDAHMAELPATVKKNSKPRSYSSHTYDMINAWTLWRHLSNGEGRRRRRRDGSSSSSSSYNGSGEEDEDGNPTLCITT